MGYSIILNLQSRFWYLALEEYIKSDKINVKLNIVELNYW